MTAESAFAPVLDQLVDYTSDEISVHLVGPRASGRSEILRRAADRLGDAGRIVLRVNGNAAWRNHPFGALTAAGIGLASAPGPRRSAGRMVAALVDQLRGQAVVVCDDADDLDQLSVGVLLAAHRQRRLVAITSSRPHRPVGAGTLMHGLTPAVRVKAPILRLEQVHQLVQGLLGGPVDPGTLALITMKSGGLHGLVAAMASVGRRTGTLVEHGGVWTAPGELWTEQLASVVEPFLADADEALWSAATTLALTGPVQLDRAKKLIQRSDLDRLFTCGMAHHLTHEGRTLVGVYPPLLADFLQREGSASGLAKAAGSIDLPVGVQPDPTGAGGADSAVLSVALVRQSADRVEAARANWSAAPTPDHAVHLIDALRFSAASPADIEEVIAATQIAGEDVDYEAAARYAWTVATWRAVALNDLPGALAGLDSAAAALPDQAPMLRVIREHLVFLRDRAPELEQVTDPMIRLGVLVAAGRVDEARALLADFAPQWQNGAVLASLYSSLADILAADFERGLERAHLQLTMARRVGDPMLILVNAYVAVFGLFVAGRLADASQLVQRTLSAPRIAGYRELLQTGVLVLGAQVAFNQGRFEQGRTMAAQASATDRGTGPFPGMAPAILAGLDPDAPDHVRGQLWTLALDRLERGYEVSAVLIAIEAVERTVDTAAAARIAAAAGSMQGRLLRAAGSYLSAVAAEDLDLIAAARDAFDASGAVLYAVRASVSRALLLRASGRTEEAAAEVDSAWRRSTVAGLDRAGMFHRLVTDVALTGRELEIVRMIARPMTTVDVARALHMSSRTVETHLTNASRKLGTAGRDALVSAATTWLS